MKSGFFFNERFNAYGNAQSFQLSDIIERCMVVINNMCSFAYIRTNKLDLVNWM